MDTIGYYPLDSRSNQAAWYYQVDRDARFLEERFRNFSSSFVTESVIPTVIVVAFSQILNRLKVHQNFKFNVRTFELKPFFISKSCIHSLFYRLGLEALSQNVF